ncbi:MAG: DsbE family thiol:disulfide interchange protein [Chromatiales bacterium]|jgi:cytochrome c biogenesis protein CcmG/thiol:disulfide interchange protein DsbE
MNKAVIPLAVFLVLVGLFWFVLKKIDEGEYDPRDIPTEFIGKSVPAFNLPNLLDATDQVKASDYQGKPWLLNVWGTWCAECWREHEYMLSLSRQGVPIVGINWRDDANEAKAMLRQNGNPFAEVGFDPKSDAVIDLGVYGAPETFLVDANGIIREKHKGAMQPQVWKEKFQPYFAQ